MLLKKNRDFLFFQLIYVQIEAKFSQYWRITPLTFYVATALDPILKLRGVKTLIEEIKSNMNTTNINDKSTIRTQLETLYLDYATRLGISITPTVPTSPPQVHKGKKKVI